MSEDLIFAELVFAFLVAMPTCTVKPAAATFAAREVASVVPLVVGVPDAFYAITLMLPIEKLAPIPPAAPLASLKP
jgi:hypothetical protein